MLTRWVLSSLEDQGLEVVILFLHDFWHYSNDLFYSMQAREVTPPLRKEQLKTTNSTVPTGRALPKPHIPTDRRSGSENFLTQTVFQMKTGETHAGAAPLTWAGNNLLPDLLAGMVLQPQKLIFGCCMCTANPCHKQPDWTLASTPYKSSAMPVSFAGKTTEQVLKAFLVMALAGRVLEL